MFTTLTALIVCAVFVYIARILEALASRFLVLLETKQASATQVPKKVDPIPQYLWINAMSESEQWAREDSLRRAYQLYEEHGNDWDKVATIMAPDSLKVE